MNYTALFHLIFATVIVSEANACDQKDKTMTIESKIEANIVQDSTSAEDAEACLRSLGLDYIFVPRARADRGVPKFQWRSPDAKGLFAAHLPGRKTRWLQLAYEEKMVYVEVDEKDIVTQVVIRPYLTGW